MPFIEGTYSPETLRRNRLVITLVALAGVVAAVVGSALSDWPMANALGIAATWLGFCAGLWWLFGSRKAGPLSLSGQSRGWFKAIGTRRRL